MPFNNIPTTGTPIFDPKIIGGAPGNPFPDSSTIPLSGIPILQKMPPNFDPFRAMRMYMEVNIKKLYSKVELPSYSTDGSGACDVRVYPEMDYDDPECESASKEIVVQPGETYLCHVGFATEFDWNWVALIYNRSGMVTKNQMGLPAGVYVIDSDYRGEWRIPIMNRSNTPKTLHSGDRIAQVIWHQCPAIKFNEVETLRESSRGNGGFGSTGVK